MTQPDSTDGPVSRGQADLHAVTNEVLELFLANVSETMARNGISRLDPDSLKQLADRFARGEDPRLQEVLARGWRTLETAFEESFWARMRRYPLERLVVSRFEDRLAERGEDPVPGRTLSRRVIPAVAAALRQMMGPDQVSDYEERARQLVESVRAAEGDGSEWAKLYSHPQADILVTDILVYIARYMTDVPKRRQWLIASMERNMPAPASEGERAWQFGDREFHLLMGALYADLAAKLRDPQERARLVKRYEEANVALVEQVVEALEIDRQRIMAGT